MTRKPAGQLGTTTVRPPDFDDFWAAIMAEANAIQLNPTMELVPMRSTAEVDVYDIGYDSLDGLRIAGWYCRPKDSYLPPPYPALLIVPGYISEPTLPKSWARMGYAALGVAPRGKLRSNRHYNPGYPGLLVDNIVDRHTYSYRGFYVDACRAVDFVRTRPEVDGTRIGVHGMTVNEVKGYGRQKGHMEIYRGAEYAVNFLPKMRIEVAVPSEQIDQVTETITAAAKTGQIGDGKIFVMPLEQAVRIRTGKTDTDAL